MTYYDSYMLIPSFGISFCYFGLAYLSAHLPDFGRDFTQVTTYIKLVYNLLMASSFG